MVNSKCLAAISGVEKYGNHSLEMQMVLFYQNVSFFNISIYSNYSLNGQYLDWLKTTLKNVSMNSSTTILLRAPPFFSFPNFLLTFISCHIQVSNTQLRSPFDY